MNIPTHTIGEAQTEEKVSDKLHRIQVTLETVKMLTRAVQTECLDVLYYAVDEIYTVNEPTFWESFTALFFGDNLRIAGNKEAIKLLKDAIIRIESCLVGKFLSKEIIDKNLIGSSNAIGNACVIIKKAGM